MKGEERQLFFQYRSPKIVRFDKSMTFTHFALDDGICIC